ncbi:ROK family protein [Sphingobacterium faecium]|uniref:ROK family protein n=1 Tax=Sphingobacterium faecium TaxID=34087 RepID=UPI002479751C|nr:ROK family protein [Sphingobacterium faecium]WGQ12873.1 ROK family protein [Sphingobacterium faecium]
MFTNENIILCIDLGGTHCSSALIDSHSQRVIDGSYYRSKVDSNAEKMQILTEIDHVIQKTMISFSGVPEQMIVSCPGPFDYENGISLMDGMNKYQSLLDFNLKKYLCQITNIPPDSVQFHNDATAFLIGEVFFKNLYQRRAVGLTLGTGLGSSLYDNGKIVDLNFGSATFVKGIVEDSLSTRGILAHLEQKFGHVPIDNIKDLIENDHLETLRNEAFDFLIHKLITFIKAYIEPLKPDTVVIGGSIAKSHIYFLEQVKASVDIDVQIASFDERNLFLGLTLEHHNI